MSKIAHITVSKLNQFTTNVSKKISNGSLILDSLVTFLISTTFSLLFILLMALTFGFCVSEFWNSVIPTMFGLGKLTLANATILIYVIILWAGNISFTNTILTEDEEKLLIAQKKAKVLSNFFNILFIIIVLIVTTILVRYSWNIILPELLSKELYKLNLLEAFDFAFLIKLIFIILHLAFSVEDSFHNYTLKFKSDNNDDDDDENDDNAENFGNKENIVEIKVNA